MFARKQLTLAATSVIIVRPFQIQIASELHFYRPNYCTIYMFVSLYETHFSDQFEMLDVGCYPLALISIFVLAT